MAYDASPICFRVPAEERSLLEAVASYQGETLSAFVRSTVIDTARRILQREGAETVLRGSRAFQERQTTERLAMLDERLKELENQLGGRTLAKTQHGEQ